MPRRSKVTTFYKQAIDGELAGISRILKNRRVELGWTQNDLAEKLECEVTTVQAYEQKRRNPSLPTLLMICKIMRLKLTIS